MKTLGHDVSPVEGVRPILQMNTKKLQDPSQLCKATMLLSELQ